MRYRAIHYSKREAARNHSPQVVFRPFQKINGAFKELNRSDQPTMLIKTDEVSGVFFCFAVANERDSHRDEYLVIPETHPLFNYYTALYSTDLYSLRGKVRAFLLPEAIKLAELFTTN